MFCLGELRSSTSQSSELGTPQGEVLSPMLFDVLLHKPVADIPFGDGESVISYADDIRIKSSSITRENANNSRRGHKGSWV